MFKDQPKALPLLFFTEMWERFGFYIVQGLLVLYTTTTLGFSDDASYAILGTFTALVYIMPVVGGYIADKVLGFNNTIIIGGVMLMMGYFILAFAKGIFFDLSLAIIIMGNGFFKPNISSILGELYKPGDTHRDSGFTIFYIGINLGALISMTIAGFVQQSFGWHAAFGMAGVGLLIGLVTFYAGKKLLKTAGKKPTVPKKAHWAIRALDLPMVLTGVVMIFVAMFTVLLEYDMASDIVLSLVAIGVFVGLFIMAMRADKKYRGNLLVLLFLIVASVMFWAVWFQLFSSANLFVLRDVRRHFGSFEIPPVLFLASEPMFIILLGPILSKLWIHLYKKKRNPSIIVKFAMGMVLVGIAFLVLYASTFFPNGGLVFPLWILGAYFIVTLGEMLLSPIGLSGVTKLSPPNLVGLMMGIWFLGQGIAGKISGWLAMIASVPEHVASRTVELSLYGSAFLTYAMIALILGAVVWIVSPYVKRLMK